MYRDLIPHWASLGWKTNVVMSQAQYRSGRSRSWDGENVEITWIPCFGLVPKGRISKLCVILLYVLLGSLKTLFGKPVGLNVFLTQPPLFFVWGWVLRVIRAQPYYIVLMDLYPDVAIEAGLLKRKSLVGRFMLTVSRFGLRKADGVVVIGRCMQARLKSLGVNSERIHFVPNWTDEQLVFPVPHDENQFREENGWIDRFVVLYSGNLGVSHYFEDLLEVARRLRHQKELVFAFIGEGQRSSEIRTYVERHGLENIQLLPFQSQDRLAESLSAGDVHFVSLRDGFEGIVVPSKSYGVFASGRPVIFQGPEQSEIYRLVKEHGLGSTVGLGCEDQLEEIILSYLSERGLATSQGAKARELAMREFSRDAACERYTRVLERAGR